MGKKIIRGKLGVSIMIGYVLLITGAIIVGAIVYTWMKSYVPRETPECPEGVSLFIEDLVCEQEDTNWNLNLTIKNNGRFEVNGYYIKAGKTVGQLATIDISKNLTSGGSFQSGIVLFPGALEPGNNTKMRYELKEPICLIEIIPIRYEVIEGKNRLVSCGDAKVKEEFTCL